MALSVLPCSDECVAKRLRSLIYTWISTDGSGPPESSPILQILVGIENGAIEVNSGSTPHPSLIVGLGSALSVQHLANAIVGMYSLTRSHAEFMNMVGVSNICFFGINVIADITVMISLATRNTVMVCKHFVEDTVTHEYLRMVNSSIDSIDPLSPLSMVALVHWAIRNVNRLLVRWTTDHLSDEVPLSPPVYDMVEGTVGQMSSKCFHVDILRVVLSILNAWYGLESPLINNKIVSNIIEYHILWHKLLRK